MATSSPSRLQSTPVNPHQRAGWAGRHLWWPLTGLWGGAERGPAVCLSRAPTPPPCRPGGCYFKGAGGWTGPHTHASTPTAHTFTHSQGDSDEEGFMHARGIPIVTRSRSPSLGASKWGGMGSLPSAMTAEGGGLAGGVALSPRMGTSRQLGGMCPGSPRPTRYGR
eukprot:361380-Chlamydomonas_euryale.AAC.3